GQGNPGDDPAVAGKDVGAADTLGDHEPTRDGPDGGAGDGGTGADGAGADDMGSDGAGNEGAGSDGAGSDGMGSGEGGDTADPDGDDLPRPRRKLTREMTLPSHLTAPASTTQDLDEAYLEQELTLRRQYIDKT